MDETAADPMATPCDGLEILRRIEPALVRATNEVEALRLGVADLVVSAVSGGFSALGAPPGVGADSEEVAAGLERLTQGLNRLAENHDRLLSALNRVRVAQEDGQERLTTNQIDLLENVEQLREDLAGHGAESGSANETLVSHMQRLRQAQKQMSEEHGLYLEGQMTLGGMVAQLEERLRRQARELKAIRRELRFLPVLWTLAALVFAAAGAAIVVLRARMM
jgi:hypothetical protein